MNRPENSTFNSDELPSSSARRFIFFNLIVIWSGLATLLFADFLWRADLYGLKYFLLVLFFLLYTYLSFGCANAIFGFFIGSRKKVFGKITTLAEPEEDSPLASTAIVIPVYNESPDRVCAGIRALYESLAKKNRLQAFDIFILSDSTNHDRWVEEEMQWIALVQDLNAAGKIHYRHRPKNIDKKSGNISNFCRSWGGRYRYMIVFDADSIMTANTLVSMVQMMEKRPEVGIIQTAPRLVRAETLFTRLQQFGSSVYGGVFLSGLNYWQQEEGNYWGHNAIIRLEPFIQHCDLPDLPGREPLGGKILSHDFVDAALMRRGGYSVWLAYDLEGSYEEGPPDLVESAKRDRRWCQGNLQHSWLLFSSELTLVNRLHFFNGILSYAASLLWLIFLIISTLVVFDHERSGLSLIAVEGLLSPFDLSLFQHGLLILGFTLVTLFLPKVLALVTLSMNRDRKSGHGGLFKASVSAVIETAFSALYAPILMLYHSQFVILGILGRGVSWGTQNRDSGDGMSFSNATRAHWIHTLIGISWGAIAWLINPGFFWSLAPVLIGMVISIPLSVALSKASLGRWFADRGFLLIPEDRNPPEEISRINPIEKELSQRRFLPIASGVESAILDPYVNAVHVELLRNQPPSQPDTDWKPLAEKLLTEGKEALSKEDLNRLMNTPQAMSWLHRTVWMKPFREVHPNYRTAATSLSKQ